MANKIEYKLNQDGTVDKEFLERVKLWTSFYRRFPYKFAEDYIGVKLKLFQKFLLYIMDNWLFTCLLASRGLGKYYA